MNVGVENLRLGKFALPMSGEPNLREWAAFCEHKMRIKHGGARARGCPPPDNLQSRAYKRRSAARGRANRRRATPSREILPRTSRKSERKASASTRRTNAERARSELASSERASERASEWKRARRANARRRWQRAARRTRDGEFALVVLPSLALSAARTFGSPISAAVSPSARPRARAPSDKAQLQSPAIVGAIVGAIFGNRANAAEARQTQTEGILFSYNLSYCAYNCASIAA